MHIVSDASCLHNFALKNCTESAKELSVAVENNFRY